MHSFINSSGHNIRDRCWRCTNIKVGVTYSFGTGHEPIKPVTKVRNSSFQIKSMTSNRRFDSLKELPVEQQRQVVVHRQLVAVPQNGRHAVEVGGRGHEQAVLPGGGGGRGGGAHACARVSSHGAVAFVGGDSWWVLDPLEQRLDSVKEVRGKIVVRTSTIK